MSNQQQIDEKFYGRRHGRSLRKQAREAIGEAEARYKLRLEDVPENLSTLFEASVKTIHLEIGFGSGEHLLHQAKLNPDIGFIGAEAFYNGFAKCAIAADEMNLKNIRLFSEDVRPLLDALPAKSLARLYLLYPDPWPKKRHWKRRMITDDNLVRFARLLRSGAEFRFCTDWADYAAWALSHLRRSEHFSWPATGKECWLTPYKDWVITRFEERAKKKAALQAI